VSRPRCVENKPSGFARVKRRTRRNAGVFCGLVRGDLRRAGFGVFVRFGVFIAGDFAGEVSGHGEGARPMFGEKSEARLDGLGAVTATGSKVYIDVATGLAIGLGTLAPGGSDGGGGKCLG
jgi:hypothetical protein